MTCTGSAGHTTSSAATVTVSAATVSSGSSGSSSSGSSSSSSGSSCSTNIPTVSSNSLYPLQQVVNFTGSTLPSVWDDYGNEVQQPAGYVAASHAVFVPGTGLEIKGYPVTSGVPGVLTRPMKELQIQEDSTFVSRCLPVIGKMSTWL
jgi:hypothetical protein